MDEKVLREYLFKEVEIVQNIINRMGTNSFLIKGWAITLVVAALLVGVTSVYHLVALVPWFMFWVLDAYFLRIEKLYRKLYGWLIKNRQANQEYLLDMDKSSLEDRFGGETSSLLRVMFSKTQILFYGLLLIIIIVTLLADVWFPASALSTL